MNTQENTAIESTVEDTAVETVAAASSKRKTAQSTVVISPEAKEISNLLRLACPYGAAVTREEGTPPSEREFYNALMTALQNPPVVIAKEAIAPCKEFPEGVPAETEPFYFQEVRRELALRSFKAKTAPLGKVKSLEKSLQDTDKALQGEKVKAIQLWNASFAALVNTGMTETQIVSILGKCPVLD